VEWLPNPLALKDAEACKLFVRLQGQSDGVEPWHQRGGGPERIKKADGSELAE